MEFMDRLCDVCGHKIASQGAQELLDGVVCEDCIRRLSPWFCDFEFSDVEEVKDQITAREENRRTVEEFHVSRRFGGPVKVLVDDEAGTFMIPRTDDISAENPDVLNFEDVMDCSLDVEETKTELLQPDGSSFSPKNYEYSYELNVEIDLDHPYLDEIVFPLRSEPLVFESNARSFLGLGGFDPEDDPEFRRYSAAADKLSDVLMGMEEDEDDKTSDLLLDEDHPDLPDGDIPVRTVLCPWCGSRSPADEDCCRHCGGKLHP